MMIQVIHKRRSNNKHLMKKEDKPKKEMKKSNNNKNYNINNNPDILIEILKRLDGQSLGVAACVCRLWFTLTQNDSLWENICFRHVYPSPSDIRHVVLALGGYKKLYMICLRPVLNRKLSRIGSGIDFGGRAYGKGSNADSNRMVESVRTREEVQLSLSLFSIDFYERLGERVGDASSLMFLCDPVNV